MMKFPNGRLLLAAALLAGIGSTGAARAADYAYERQVPATAGISCDVGWAGWSTVLPAAWSSVWLGHFSGGTARYNRQTGTAAIAWDDEKRCFPTRRSCSTWVEAMRQDYQQVEGYWTCMPLR
jgi:hypothetical protein